MSERILVTGATRPVGGELVRLLVEAGPEVKVGTRRPEWVADLFAPGVKIVELDYGQPATFDAALEWADRGFLQPPSFDPDVTSILGHPPHSFHQFTEEQAKQWRW